MEISRLVIAGTHSGVGKTTVAIAMMRALASYGIKVQPFKVGPDYIDPGYHTAATGLRGRNLDSWLLGADGVREMFLRSAPEEGLSIIEGVMGLYDGRGSEGEGSTAHVAAILDAPVILVLDARSMSRSAAALVLGYKTFDPKLRLCGVFLNRVGSERHYLLLKDAIESTTGVPVLGWLSVETPIELPERHLGLLPANEKANLTMILDRLANKMAAAVNLEQIIRMARTASNLSSPLNPVFPAASFSHQIRLGVVMDQAFHFYYQDGLDFLDALGADIIPCSALEGELPPNLDGLYIGGGFPEMFASTIAENTPFIQGVREHYRRGMPIYAECGGMMFLSTGITDLKGDEYPMAGVIPGKTVMLQKRAGLGYVSAQLLRDNLLGFAGQKIRGHEFHYSVLEGLSPENHAYLLEKAGDKTHPDGYAYRNLLASYLHVHFAGCPEQAEHFLQKCVQYRQKRLIATSC